MTAVRNVIMDPGGMARNSRNGDNAMTSMMLTKIATDANQVLALAAISGGLIQFTSFTAGRVVTTDTAANIILAFPQMDIGDTFIIIVSNTQAFAATWAAGTGVTLAGKATTLASGFNFVAITKTGAATVEWNVL
jgi:hypothetical protein